MLFFPCLFDFFIQLFAKLKLPEDRGVIQLAECLNSMHKAWVHSLALQKAGMVVCTCDPSTQGLDGEKFSIIFDYIASSRPVWDPEEHNNKNIGTTKYAFIELNVCIGLKF